MLGQTVKGLNWPEEFYGRLSRADPSIFGFLRYAPGARAVRAMLAGLARDGLRVLDIGSGHGVGGCHLAAAGVRAGHYTGVDPDPLICPEARSILAMLPPGCLEVEVLPTSLEAYLDSGRGLESFDLIYWDWSIHHIADAREPSRLAGLLARVAARLSAGGALLVGDGFIADGASEEERARIVAYNARVAGARANRELCVGPSHLRLAAAAAGLRPEAECETPMGVFTPRDLPHARYFVMLLRKPGSGA